MKKNLLFAALFMGALTASAQTETILTDKESLEAIGITSEAATLENIVIASSENVTMSLPYSDSYKQTKIAFQGYDQAIVNGTSAELGWGVTGSSNPGGQALVDTENSTAANSGCVVQFTVKKDGYLTVFGKNSSNKEYYVWEGNAEAAYPVAYTFAMDWSAGKEAGAAVDQIVYTLPADKDGYLDFAASNIATYVSGSKYVWPEKVVLGADAADVRKNGVGAIIFPVYAEAGTYLVHAAGSKISTCGAVFTTEPVTAFALVSHDESGAQTGVLNLIGSTDGINNINAAEATANAPIYNLAGQQVSKAYKGVVILNGQKFIQK